MIFKLANPKSDADALDAVVREILHRVEHAKQACFMPGYLTRRYGCVDQAKALIEASGLLFFTGTQDVGVLSQQHPQFGGNYLGKFMTYEPNVTKYFEACDCIIGIAPEDHEFNNGFHTMNYDFKSTINIKPHQTRVGLATYDNVEMVDVLTALAAKIGKSETPAKIEITKGFGAPTGEAGDKITYEPLYERIQAFLRSFCRRYAFSAMEIRSTRSVSSMVTPQATGFSSGRGPGLWLKKSWVKTTSALTISL